MSATRIGRRIQAPRAAVYRAFLDARAVASWMVPDGMNRPAPARLPPIPTRITDTL
jgi:uncharacterized protein YndB with AHSA1/START domain